MNENSTPPVSLIIPVYNRGAYVAKAIESALAQNYPNLEIIISDNCSTDGTDEVIKKYLGDPRIHYSRNETNIGMIANFRKATYELARGEYITYLSSDDYLTDPAFISDCIAVANKYDNIILVFGRGRIINEQLNAARESEGEYWKQEFWSGKDVFFKTPEYGLLSWLACVMRKDALFRMNGLHKNYLNGDTECNYKMMLQGNVGFVNKLVHDTVYHGQNATASVKAGDKILYLECLDDICVYALQKMPEEKERIDAWKNKFLYDVSYEILKLLKVKNETEYRIFKKLLSERFPVTYGQLRRQGKLRAFLIYHSIRNKLGKNS